MQRFRRSFSLNKRPSIEDEDALSHLYLHVDNNANSRSSFDTFVIPGRTRYPSGTTPAPKPIDLQITENLLEESSKALLSLSNHGVEEKPSTFANRDSISHGVNFSSDHSDSDPGSRRISCGTVSDWSRFSFTRSSLQSCTSKVRVLNDYLDKYNILAAKYGLGNLSTFTDADVEVDQTQLKKKRKSSPRKSVWGRLVRSSSSSNVKKLRHPQLKHKSSVGSVLSWRPRAISKCQSLDEMYRVSGVSVVHLPASYCAVSLIVPVYIAATANHLARHGQGTAGIFRIPGQSSMVNAVYEYYAAQIASIERSADFVHNVVGASDLPTELHCTTHDVASAFKRFLWDMPGGILGSLKLFNSLYEIASYSPIGHEGRFGQDQVKLITFALLCLKSARRIALISTVFGLLALLRREAATSVDPIELSPNTPMENMSSKALSVIFAPLLLGPLTDKIQVEETRASPLLIGSYQSPKRSKLHHGKSNRSAAGVEQSPRIKVGLKQTSAAAAVVEMLICSWEEVVQQTKSLEVNPRPRNGSVFSARPENHTTPSQDHSGVTKYRDSEIYGPSHYRKAQGFQQYQKSTKDSPAEYTRALSTTDDPYSDAFVCDQFPWEEKRDINLGIIAHNLEPQSQTSENLYHGDPHPQVETDTPSTKTRTLQTPELTHQALACWEKKSHTEIRPSKIPLVPDVSCAAKTNGRTSPVVCSASARIPSIVITGSWSSNAVDMESNSSKVDLKGSLDNETLDVCRTLGLPAISRSSDGQTLPEDVSCSMRSNHRPPIIQIASSSLVPFPATLSDLKDTQTVTEVHQGTQEVRPAKLSRTDLSDSLSKSLHNQSQASVLLTPTPYVKKLSKSLIPRPITESLRDRHKKSSVFNERTPSGYPASAPPQDNATRQLVRERGHVLISSQHNSQKGIDNLKFLAPGKLSSRSRHLLCSSAEISGPKRQPLPFADEPPIARRLNFRALRDEAGPTSGTSRKDTHADENYMGEPSTAGGLQGRVNVGTLYKEIRRLNRVLDAKLEENLQLQQQLDAVRRFRSAGTLSQQLREKEREAKLWRHRAEWTEAVLFRQRVTSNSRGPESEGNAALPDELSLLSKNIP